MSSEDEDAAGGQRRQRVVARSAASFRLYEAPRRAIKEFGCTALIIRGACAFILPGFAEAKRPQEITR